MKRRPKTDEDTGINVTPMLDIVFIMLIFFIVTTSFVREEGLEVSRPSATPPREVTEERGPIVVRIDANSQIVIKGRAIDLKAVPANLERERVEKPQAPLVVAAHPDAETRALVSVLDAARAVGIEEVSVATSAE
jgi:biopolymer transport protein ExbD